MSDETSKEDQLLLGLVRRSIIEKGFRPESDAEIAQCIDAIGGGDLSNEKRDRMLDKIFGRTPMIWNEPASFSNGVEADSSESREFAEMFRSQGESLPDDLEEKLRELEGRASEPDEEDGDQSDE
jgi:hypothetical protein